jgi:hypothetical protein
MSSAVPQYTFIVSPGPKASKRMRELRLARIRSHAAKASWHRRGIVQQYAVPMTDEPEFVDEHRSIPLPLSQTVINDEDSAPSFGVQVPETIRICMFRPLLYSL